MKMLCGANLAEQRTKWEPEKHPDKKSYQLRKQEEEESRRALRDFQKHLKEDEEWKPSQLE